MLGSAVPPASATPTSSTRQGRLRGLSYLRNYTRDHLPGSTRSDASPPSEATIVPQLNESHQRTRMVSPTQEQQDSLQRREGAGATEAFRYTEVNGTDREERGVVLEASPLDDDAISEADPSIDASAGAIRRRTTSGRTEHAPIASNVSRTLQAQLSNGNVAADEHGESAVAGNTNPSLPTIRFIPHAEARSSRPSLQFSAVTRTLRQPNSIVRVGRYSERDMNNTPTNSSVSPVGFKSKVVSRRHCEFWCTNGQWYVKDVKSSSGTFLNHVRLSSPGVESRPYPVNDGDVVQLGIDFKGGEEVIFRCVKIRIECNRGWQKSLNNFNTSAHKRLLKNNKGRDSDGASTSSSECSICLNPVAPCQALFVAPCSHVWHYKCIRNLVQGPNWPNFLCPNCRFVADLEADVEPPEDFDLSSLDEADQKAGAEMANGIDDPEEGMADDNFDDDEREHADTTPQEAVERAHEAEPSQRILDDELVDMLNTTDLRSQSPDFERSASQPRTRPVDISTNTTSSAGFLEPRSATPTSDTPFALAAGVLDMPSSFNEGPSTPRNAAGPFVFDGQDRELGD